MDSNSTNDNQIVAPKAPMCRSSKIFLRTGIAIFIIVLIVAGIGWSSYLASTKAINDYVSDIDSQYSDLSQNKNIDQPTRRLQNVPLGKIVNPRYKAVANLESEYIKLTDALRKYSAVITKYNTVVKIFNDQQNLSAPIGQEDDNKNPKVQLDSSVLESVDNLLSSMRTNYPDNKSSIDKLSKLKLSISSASYFSEIYNEATDALSDNDNWLKKHREQIEQLRQEFQTKLSKESH